MKAEYVTTKFCPKFCKECINDRECVSCMDGFDLAANGVCYNPKRNFPVMDKKNGGKCPMNCKVCLHESMECVECNVGYLLDRSLEC